MKESLLFTRREFLRAGGILAVGAAIPAFLVRTAEAAADAHGAIRGFADGRILVVVQLAGGNDGLNTLVPVDDDAYHRVRPRIGLKRDKLLMLDDGRTGLNPRLAGLKELLDDGRAAVVEGVGYPNPNRSHFRSMEIWHTATDSNRYSDTGWIGRYLDAQCGGEGEPVAAVAVGGQRPQAFAGRRGLGVAMQDPGSFGWTEGPGPARVAAFRDLNRPGAEGGSNLDFVRKVAADAVLGSDRVRAAARAYRGGVEYPRDPFGQGLQTVAKMIAGGLQTRIFHVTLGGFDTHANQSGTHDNLLERLGNGLLAFQRDLDAQGNADRVVTMTFSEFGRRVAENASGGTDHGTAAPMFVIGSPVRPGFLGARPSLTDLDNGDLKHTTDFRAVYATVLEQWLRAPAAGVLGRDFAPVGRLV